MKDVVRIPKKTHEVAKPDRRNLIKLLFVGGGAFVVGKLFGSFIDLFTDNVISTTEFKNFKFVETEKTMTISDKSGEALLIVDKDSGDE
ncbi:MAG: hypothetical protein K0S38_240 [Candidatus Paceibacter sp.]|jgi:hypothetical protein|nr:hypothetical protein [Candidatus Paceibacter sp.]